MSIEEIGADTGGSPSEMVRVTKVSVDSSDAKEALSKDRLYSSPEEELEYPLIS